MPQLVRDAGDERRLRPDDDQIHLERAGQAEQALAVLGADRMTSSEQSYAGISRCGMELFEARRLAQLPRERVLTPAGTDQEHFHTWI